MGWELSFWNKSFFWNTSDICTSSSASWMRGEKSSRNYRKSSCLNWNTKTTREKLVWMLNDTWNDRGNWRVIHKPFAMAGVVCLTCAKLVCELWCGPFVNMDDIVPHQCLHSPPAVLLCLPFTWESTFKAGQSKLVYDIVMLSIIFVLICKNVCSRTAQTGRVFLCASVKSVNKECNALLWAPLYLILFCLSLLVQQSCTILLIVKLLFTVAAKWKTDCGYCAMPILKST